ncbi:MAG: hypothetical protein JWQ19_603 [Subtercola sp.]|nr:hypothetical protein [Subtercola sp.]
MGEEPVIVDAQHVPTGAHETLPTDDVFSVLGFVRAMLIAVVLDDYAVLPKDEIGSPDAARGIVDHGVHLSFRQCGLPHQQPQKRLRPRLRSLPHKFKCSGCP